MQLQNEWVDQKLARAVKKGIMMARLLADKFERFHGMIIPQRRRGALPKVVQGRSKIGAALTDLPTFKNRPCFADVGPIRPSDLRRSKSAKT